MRFSWVAKLGFSIYLVEISATNALDCQVSLFFEISDDALGSALSYTNPYRNLSDQSLRVLSEINQDMAVV